MPRLASPKLLLKSLVSLGRTIRWLMFSKSTLSRGYRNAKTKAAHGAWAARGTIFQYPFEA